MFKFLVKKNLIANAKARWGYAGDMLKMKPPRLLFELQTTTTEYPYLHLVFIGNFSSVQKCLKTINLKTKTNKNVLL